MASVRTPAVAGQFYPGDAADLSHVVDESLAAASSTPVDPVAVITPHAGYRWSAPVAASAHAALANRPAPIERVVVAGPTHKVGVNGIGVSSAAAFATPLGDVRIDTDAVAAVRDLPGVVPADRSHDREYCIEVQLPFIQRLHGDVPIVPLVVSGSCPHWRTADIFERLWRDDSTAVMVSSDLSHHNQIDRARELDSSTTRSLEQLDIDAITPDLMCGAGAVRGLMKVALRRHLQVHALDVRNSGDFGADPARVVGYGAFALSDDPQRPLGPGAGEALLELADASARYRVANDRPLDIQPMELPDRLSDRGAAFVSVKVDDVVRGCIGRIEPVTPLSDTVAWAATVAVEGRAWFTAISRSDLDDLVVEVHVMSALERLHARSAEELAGLLRPGEDGLIIFEEGSQATYLPSVWETTTEPEAFISGLLAKGSFDEQWTEQRAAYRYSTDVLTPSAA